MPLFSNKYKFVQKILLNVVSYSKILIIYCGKSIITFNRDYYNSDVISKTSYFIHKIKYTLHNF